MNVEAGAVGSGVGPLAGAFRPFRLAGPFAKIPTRIRTARVARTIYGRGMYIGRVEAAPVIAWAFGIAILAHQFHNLSPRNPDLL